MAIVKIQHRRGNYADYDPTKVLPGELVVTQADDPNSSDGKAVYIGTTSGDVKQLATVDELHSEVETTVHDAMNTELKQEIDDVWREAIASEIQTGSWPEAIASEIESKTETAWRETIDAAVEDATQAAEDAADRAESAAQTLVIDTTLTQTGQAAEAKAVGDEITALNSSLPFINSGTVLAYIKSQIAAGHKNGRFLSIDLSDNPATGHYFVEYYTHEGTGNIRLLAQHVNNKAFYVSNVSSSDSAISSWTRLAPQSAVDELNSSTMKVVAPKDLVNNADLLSLSVGEYTATAAVSTTLVNCPVSGTNFKLTVYMRTVDRKNYELIDLNGNIYINCQTAASSYTGWIKQPTRSEFDTLNSNFTHFAIVNLGSTGTTDTTINSTDWTQITSGGTIWLAAGKYMFIATINATWASSGYQFFPGLNIANQNVSSLYNYATAQTNQPTMIMGYVNILTDGTYTVYAIGRVTGTSKQVTIPSYQTISCMLFYRN